jgi:Tol biopolymer transport system component
VFAPDGRSVAYSWWEEGQGGTQVRAVGLDGSRPRVIYYDQYFDTYPKEWSRDGSQILALANGEDRDWRIVLISTADSSMQVLKTLDWRSPVEVGLSPDGRYVIYDVPADGVEERDIYVIDVGTGSERPLVEHEANDVVLGWTPDGGHVFFGSDRTGTVGGWLLPVADGRPAGDPWLAKPDMWRATPIGFARDGSYFYCVHTSDWDVYLATIDLESGSELVAPARVDQRYIGGRLDGAWSPDGRYLAYLGSADRLGAPSRSRPIAVRSMETGEVRELLTGLNRISRFHWSPDGRFLLIAARDEDNQKGLYRVDLQTAERSLLVGFDVSGYGAIGWSADGSSVYYGVNYGDGRRVIERNLDSGRERILYHAMAPTEIEGPVVVSPDDRRMAFVIDEEGAERLVTMATTGSALKTVYRFETDHRFSDLRWTPDGESLLYNTMGAGTSADPDRGLWLISTGGGTPRRIELTKDGIQRVSDVRIHPDGRRIAFTAGEYAAEIWVMSDFLPSY